MLHVARLAVGLLACAAIATAAGPSAAGDAMMAGPAGGQPLGIGGGSSIDWAVPLPAQAVVPGVPFTPPAPVDGLPDDTAVADPEGTGESSAMAAPSALADSGLPVAASAAYRRAADAMATSDPGCGLHWSVLAGIGRVESNHGRYAGAVLGSDGKSRPPVIGIPLDGNNETAVIADTDGGELDGDIVWDRAVGPMQFIPSTWAVAARDGDGDGVTDPQDIDDAAMAAAAFLCSGDSTFKTYEGAREAVWRYNHSYAYVELVLSLASLYETGGVVNLPSPPVLGPTAPPVPAPTPTPIPSPSPSGSPIPSPSPSESPSPSPSGSPSPSESPSPSPSESPSPSP